MKRKGTSMIPGLNTRSLWKAIVIALLTSILMLNLFFSFSSSTPRATTDDFYDAPLQRCNGPVNVMVDHEVQVREINSSETAVKWFSIKPGQAKVMGYQRTGKSFLTIGVPSIKRMNGMKYLIETLSSLVENTSVKDKTQIVVVVFLADYDEDYNKKVSAKVLETYPEYVKMGFIQILRVTKDFYPDLTPRNLKRNFNDDPTRVMWRSKQVADYAFLFMYGHNQSEYYIQIEDDVISAPNFLSSIKKFINTQDKTWAILEFSELGFIGKLFKSADLPKLSQFMITFYQEQPVDWLINYFRQVMAQDKIILRKPTLFQHFGLKSSFDTSKDNKLKDRFFDTGEKQFQGADDPPAIVATNIRPFEQNIPDLAYASGSGYFWGRDIKKGDYFYILFDKDERLKRVAVQTGNDKHMNDILQHGTIEISPKLLKRDGYNVTCANLMKVGTFEKGNVDINSENTPLLSVRTTKCIKITVTEDQADWLIIQQVAVYIFKEDEQS